MKNSCRFEPLTISVSSRLYIQNLNLTIDACSYCIGDVKHNRVNDSPTIVFDWPGHSPDRLQSASDRPIAPALPNSQAQTPTRSIGAA